LHAEIGDEASRPRGSQDGFDEIHSRLLVLELDRRARAEKPSQTLRLLNYSGAGISPDPHRRRIWPAGVAPM
jgi:hypothetical protein